MSRTLYRGALIPEHRADFLRAAPLAPVWTDELSTPGAGRAVLLRCYGGDVGGSTRWVYRRARSAGGRQEHRYHQGRRLENLLAAGDIDSSASISIAGSNVTEVGRTTHLGLPCNFITWPAAVHDFDTSDVTVGQAYASAEVGQQFCARVEVAVSRPMEAGEVGRVSVIGPSGNGYIEFQGLPSGMFLPVGMKVSTRGACSASGSIGLHPYLSGTFGSPITIYIRRRMIIDATGLTNAECVPDFIDPSADYGFGCVGVRWFATKTGNTVSSNGVIREEQGALLRDPLGVIHQPAVTGLASYSPPRLAEDSALFQPSATSVAGLPAIGCAGTTSGSDELASIVVGPTSGTTIYSCHLIAKIEAEDAVLLRCSAANSGSTLFQTDLIFSAEYATIVSSTVVGSSMTTTSRVVSLGENDYFIEAAFTPPSSSYSVIVSVHELASIQTPGGELSTHTGDKIFFLVE